MLSSFTSCLKQYSSSSELSFSTQPILSLVSRARAWYARALFANLYVVHIFVPNLLPLSHCWYLFFLSSFSSICRKLALGWPFPPASPCSVSESQFTQGIKPMSLLCSGVMFFCHNLLSSVWRDACLLQWELTILPLTTQACHPFWNSSKFVTWKLGVVTSARHANQNVSSYSPKMTWDWAKDTEGKSSQSWKNLHEIYWQANNTSAKGFRTDRHFLHDTIWKNSQGSSDKWAGGLHSQKP